MELQLQEIVNELTKLMQVLKFGQIDFDYYEDIFSNISSLEEIMKYLFEMIKKITEKTKFYMGL